MPIRHTYLDNVILVYPAGDAWFFLFDADGDINEYHADSLDKARKAIDQRRQQQGGLYDAYGDIIP